MTFCLESKCSSVTERVAYEVLGSQGSSCDSKAFDGAESALRCADFRRGVQGGAHLRWVPARWTEGDVPVLGVFLPMSDRSSTSNQWSTLAVQFTESEPHDPILPVESIGGISGLRVLLPAPPLARISPVSSHFRVYRSVRCTSV